MARELAVKTRNAIKRRVPGAEVQIKNVLVNGRKLGCNGFIRNPANGKTAYLDTDVLDIGGKRYLYRSVENMEDYRGGINQWAKTFEEFIDSACRLIA